ncbi:MAG: FAD:protein FMN transferase, partial [Zoogloea sp.]|nr:FAD:protein FMN transferase [Zoogloea sp.]
MNARTPALARRVLLPAVIRDELPVPGSMLHEFCGETMGTTWSVRLADHLRRPRQDWQAGIQAQLDAVVAEMSHWRPDSDLGRFNLAPAGTWLELPEDFFRVLSYALSVAAD